MTFLKSKLIKLAEKYNRSLITISAITWKDVIASGGKKGDIMLNRTIKKDKLHDEFDIVKEPFKARKNDSSIYNPLETPVEYIEKIINIENAKATPL